MIDDEIQHSNHLTHLLTFLVRGLYLYLFLFSLYGAFLWNGHANADVRTDIYNCLSVNLSFTELPCDRRGLGRLGF
jgi:hypothetical protein